MLQFLWDQTFGDGKTDFLGMRVDPLGIAMLVIAAGAVVMWRKAGNFAGRLGEDDKLREKTTNVAKFALNLWRLK